jgi:4-amino-4-deoxy-L-arabinose transferase-like glycosyltransferase
VVALVLVASAIRILVIDNQSLWADEALTAYETRLPFGSMINVVLHVETTPPLYFVLIWTWSHVIGTGDVALRSLSTLAGIAVVPITYLAGRELASRRAGVVAAAFVTVNPFLIWYSQEARAYMLLVALSGASFLWFARARREPSTRNLRWWAACSSLALLTHFFAAFLVAPEALWLLWTARTRLVATAVAVVAVVEAAIVPLAFLDTSHGPGWIAHQSRLNRTSHAISEWGVSILVRRTPVAVGLIGGAVLLVLVTTLAVGGGDRRTRDAVAVGAAIGGFVWIAPLALAYLGQDYFLSRNVMPAVVPLIVAVAAACAAPRARVAGGALAAALLGMFAFAAIDVQSHPYLERPNWRAVARALGPAKAPRGILASDGTTADPLKIYLPHVDWSEPRGRRIWIREIDVVGATKHLGLLSARTRPSVLVEAGLSHPRGPSVPRAVAPRGTWLISRFRVDNWVLGRFGLRRPIRVGIDRLAALAPRFFQRTPRGLLAFLQQSAR